MTNQEAIRNFQRRDGYIVGRIEALTLEGKPTSGLEKDREAIALALAALQFVVATLEYEAAQSGQPS